MQFRVLGPLEVLDDAGNPVVLRSGRQRTTLSVLLCYRNRPVAKDRLIDLIWPGEAPESAPANLQTYVYRLRQALGEDRIAHRAGGYLIQTEHDEVDADRFDALVTEAEAARLRGEWDTASTHLATALDLWHGTPYAGLEDIDVLHRAAAALEESRLTALETRLDVDLRRGQHDLLVSELVTLVEEHPVRERFRAQLMLALHRSGRTADALESYRRGRQLLVDELGIEPGNELRELHQQILDDDPALPASPRQTAPTLVPAELPADLRSVVGRDDELVRLDRLAEGGDGGPAVVVVSGPPGVGKSTLTIHWAHRNRRRFPDGQVFVYLGRPGTAMSTTAALSHLVRSFGHEGDLPEQVDELAALYRSVTAERTFLLVLDNAADVDQIVQLFPSAPRSAVLVTSRSRLIGLMARADARLLDLDMLSAAASLAFLARLIGQARCGEQPDAAGDLVKLCGRLPLALGIVGAHLASRPDEALRGYADRLGADVLSSLAIDGDVHVTRAFHDSYAALTPDAQRLFRLLGSLPGATFSLRAAAAALGEPMGIARRLLDHLVMRSLVRPVEGDRCTVHDLLKLYAEQLANQRPRERDEAAERYLDWLADAVTCASDLLFRVPLRLPAMPEAPAAAAWMTDSSIAFQWLDAEVPTLREAVELAGRLADPAKAAVLVTGLPMRFWRRRHPAEWADVLDAAVCIEHAEADNWVAVALRRARATFHLARFDLDAAEAAYREALPLSRELAWAEAEALVLNGLGAIAIDRGALKDGYQLLLQAIRVDPSLPITLANLAAICVSLGRPREAVMYAERGLSQSDRPILYCLLGAARRQLGEFRLSNTALATAYVRSREDQDHHSEAVATELESRLRLEEGNPDRARELAMRASTLAREHQIIDIALRAEAVLGNVELASGRYTDAAHLFGRVLELAAERDYLLAKMEATRGLAMAALGRGDASTARDLAGKALRLATDTDRRFDIGFARLTLARIAWEGRDHDDARDHALKALDAFGESRHPAVVEARTIAEGA